MQLFLAGAENPSWRQELEKAGVQSVAMNFAVLQRRLPKHKTYLLSERFPDDVAIALEAGDVSKRNLSDEELDAWVEMYHDLVEANEASLAVVTEIDAYPDYETVVENREIFWSNIESFLPMWRKELGYDELDNLCQGWDGVALAASDLDGDHRVRAILQEHVQQGARVHAVGLGRADDLLRFPVTSASTAAWTSPKRYGDLVFWDGNQMHRFPSAYREDGLKRFRTRIAAAGFDPDKLAAEDPEELLRLSIWSYQRLEERAQERRNWQIATTEPVNEVAVSDQTPVERPATEVTQAVNGTRHQEPRQTVLLPLLRTETETVKITNEDGEEEVHERQVASVGSGNVLQCSTCHIASVCPEAQPGATCAYEIPVSLKTNEDLNRFLSGILEMQGKRVLFSQFGEELEGGHPKPETSREIDRLFGLVAKLKEIQDNRDVLKLSAEVRAGQGMLSRIFGSSVGEAQTQLAEPVHAGELAATVIDVPSQ